MATRPTSRSHIINDIRASSESDGSSEFPDSANKHCCSSIPSLCDTAACFASCTTSKRQAFSSTYFGPHSLPRISAQALTIVPTAPQWSEASLVWLSSLIWGELYVHGTAYLGIWNGTNVRLFGVRHTPQPRGMGEAMQNVIGGLGWGPPPASSASQLPAPRTSSSRSNSTVRPAP